MSSSSSTRIDVPLAPPRIQVAARRAPLRSCPANSSTVRYSHGEPRVQLQRLETDRAQQVRLSQPRLGIEEQRVIDLARRFGDRARGRHGQPVGRAGDEALETEPAVEHA